MKVTYNTTEIKVKVKFQTGYYTLPGGGGGDLATKLDKGTYTGNASDLKNDIDSKANTSHTHNISDVSNLQTALDSKLDVEKLAPLATNYIPFFHGSGYFFNSSLYVDTTHGNFVGLNKTDPTETLDVNGNVKATGFKTPTGTTTQALTADGGIYNLNTKADLVGGKVPAYQLPAYVDDVLEFANLASFPATGESGKIYIALDTNLTYRWGGSSYVVMSSSLALGETSSTAYRGDRGKIAYDHSQTTGNPHGTTKSDIGLGNVPNLDTTNAVNDSHSHSNKSILDLITEPFTTSLKSLYDGVVNENKKATITVELISQLTTNFYAPNALRINSTALISGSGTLTLKVNDVAYTLGNLIPQGAKITAETTSSSVFNLISIYE